MTNKEEAKKSKLICILTNDVDTMKLSDGDKILCTYSTVKDRKGKIFTASTSSSTSKKAQAKGIVPKWWLSHCCSYGDMFDLIDQ